MNSISDIHDGFIIYSLILSIPFFTSQYLVSSFERSWTVELTFPWMVHMDALWPLPGSTEVKGKTPIDFIGLRFRISIFFSKVANSGRFMDFSLVFKQERHMMQPQFLKELQTFLICSQNLLVFQPIFFLLVEGLLIWSGNKFGTLWLSFGCMAYPFYINSHERMPVPTYNKLLSPLFKLGEGWSFPACSIGPLIHIWTVLIEGSHVIYTQICM